MRIVAYPLVLTLPQKYIAERISSSGVPLISHEGPFDHLGPRHDLVCTFRLGKGCTLAGIKGFDTQQKLSGPFVGVLRSIRVSMGTNRCVWKIWNDLRLQYFVARLLWPSLCG